MKSELKNTMQVWEHLRPVLLALGLDELVEEYEHLAVDSSEVGVNEANSFPARRRRILFSQ